MARGYLIFVLLAGVFASMMGGGMTGFRSSDALERRTKEASASSADHSSATATSDSSSNEGSVELQRSSDGHFYADVEINGATVHALVDTGASGIALSRDDARSAGLATSIGMNDVIGRGADGDVRGEYITLDSVSLGHKRAEGMQAIVLNSGEQSLLGQNFLSKFDSVEIQGDRMVLR
jgi:aspartyl protease family protein